MPLRTLAKGCQRASFAYLAMSMIAMFDPVSAFLILMESLSLNEVSAWDSSWEVVGSRVHGTGVSKWSLPPKSHIPLSVGVKFLQSLR